MLIAFLLLGSRGDECCQSSRASNCSSFCRCKHAVTVCQRDYNLFMNVEELSQMFLHTIDMHSDTFYNGVVMLLTLTRATVLAAALLSDVGLIFTVDVTSCLGKSGRMGQWLV